MLILDRCRLPVVLGAALLVVSGCGGHRGGRDASRPLVGHRQTSLLCLAAGASSGEFTITAPPPPEYAWNVGVTALPADVVTVRIRTWYGADLSVVESTRDAEVCRRDGGSSRCCLRFPLLEAQRGGRWSVIASKRSGPAAAVHIAITFYKP
jgi:hypothetical protein